MSIEHAGRTFESGLQLINLQLNIEDSEHDTIKSTSFGAKYKKFGAVDRIQRCIQYLFGYSSNDHRIGKADPLLHEGKVVALESPAERETRRKETAKVSAAIKRGKNISIPLAKKSFVLKDRKINFGIQDQFPSQTVGLEQMVTPSFYLDPASRIYGKSVFDRFKSFLQTNPGPLKTELREKYGVDCEIVTTIVGQTTINFNITIKPFDEAARSSSKRGGKDSPQSINFKIEVDGVTGEGTTNVGLITGNKFNFNFFTNNGSKINDVEYYNSILRKTCTVNKNDKEVNEYPIFPGYDIGIICCKLLGDLLHLVYLNEYLNKESKNVAVLTGDTYLLDRCLYHYQPVIYRSSSKTTYIKGVPTTQDVVGEPPGEEGLVELEGGTKQVRAKKPVRSKDKFKMEKILEPSKPKKLKQITRYVLYENVDIEDPPEDAMETPADGPPGDANETITVGGGGDYLKNYNESKLKDLIEEIHDVIARLRVYNESVNDNKINGVIDLLNKLEQHINTEVKQKTAIESSQFNDILIKYFPSRFLIDNSDVPTLEPKILPFLSDEEFILLFENGNINPLFVASATKNPLKNVMLNIPELRGFVNGKIDEIRKKYPEYFDKNIEIGKYRFTNGLVEFYTETVTLNKLVPTTYEELILWMNTIIEYGFLFDNGDILDEMEFQKILLLAITNNDDKLAYTFFYLLRGLMFFDGYRILDIEVIMDFINSIYDSETGIISDTVYTQSNENYITLYSILEEIRKTEVDDYGDEAYDIEYAEETPFIPERVLGNQGLIADEKFLLLKQQSIPSSAILPKPPSRQSSRQSLTMVPRPQPRTNGGKKKTLKKRRTRKSKQTKNKRTRRNKTKPHKNI